MSDAAPSRHGTHPGDEWFPGHPGVAEGLADLAAARGAHHVQLQKPGDREDRLSPALEQGGVSLRQDRAFEPYDMAE